MKTKRLYERPQMTIVDLQQRMMLLAGSQVSKGKDFDGWNAPELSFDDTMLDEE